MKSVVLNDNKVEIINEDKPVLKGLGAIVKVFVCGLCGSDLVKIKERAKNIKLGHEVVGEIVSIKSNTNFKIGDIVALGHHYPCFECDFCKRGHHSQCKTFKSTNIEPCGFSEYIYVSEGHLKNTVFMVPKGMSVETASFLEPLGCCIRSVRNADIKQNSKALIIGMGSIGILMGQAVKAFGGCVTGIDLVDERVEFAKKHNFDFAYNLKNIDIKQEFDTIFMTSGADNAIETAFSAVKNGGKIVVFSSVPKNSGYANNEIYYRELTVMGSYSPSPADLASSMELLETGKVDVSGVSVRYPIDEINKAINDTIENKILKALIEL